MRLAFLFFLIIITFGCNPISKNEDKTRNENVIASVGEEKLLKSQVDLALNGRVKYDDSAAIFQNYVDQWIKRKAMHAFAIQNLSQRELNKDSLLKQYYEDLVFYELQQNYLDTAHIDTVSEKEVQEYYKSYPSNFELKENIVKLDFYKIPLHVKRIDELWSNFKSGQKKKINLLQQVTEMSGGYYFSNDSIWLSFNDVQKEIPIETYNQEHFLNNNKWIKTSDQNYAYLVHIKAFKVKNSKSPLDFERERIKSAILYQRKVALLQQLENQIVKEMYQQELIQRIK